jgi:hypothetical protein
MRFTRGGLSLAVLAAAALSVGAVLGVSLFGSSKEHESFRGPHFLAQERGETLLGRHHESGEPANEAVNGPAQDLYDEAAYPASVIAPAQQRGAHNAAKALDKLSPAKTTGWQQLGPNGVPASATVAGESTGGSESTVYSGRTTAVAISPSCTAGNCLVLIGAAGGGVWATSDGLASSVSWHSSNSGIASNAIGSIAFDPSNSNTIYAGTGEPNGSSDSEAGVGLYKSTDGGSTWSLVSGSTATNAPCADGSGNTCSVATGRSIGAIAVDPNNPNHIFIGTDVARHGSSSVNGGRFTPPASAKVGLYESTNGGASFSPVLILPQDTTSPGSANGGDFFRGGLSNIQLYRSGGETQVYASAFDYGLFRRSSTLDGDSSFHQVFKSGGGGAVAGSLASRTEFSLAPNGSNLRIYLGDADVNGLGQLYRIDNANVAASSIVKNGNNTGWTSLSNSGKGSPGFGSYNYCETQCSYDMPVWSPPGAPNIVYIGGAMHYDEIFTAHRPSNGRGVQRSEDAGINFTDMTQDNSNVQAQGSGLSIHPDQHALATPVGMPNTLLIADDGGLWRVNGDSSGFTNASSQCSGRGLNGTDLVDCQAWLSKIPNSITELNSGLDTLQYQSLSLDPNNPLGTLLGGTQDNGTHLFNSGSWSVNVFGDGGQSGISPFDSSIRFHNYFNASPDVNFHGNSETGWDSISDPLFGVEPQSFYIPMIFDPKVSGTMFAGLNFIWRTTDNGGDQTALDTHCNELTGDFTITCGDWVRVENTDSTYALGTGAHWGADKTAGGYVVATERASSDNGTLWVGTRRGRVFVTKNATASDPAAVDFRRIDTSSQPTRFVSGIAVDPSNPNHAFVSYSGYNAYATAAGTAQGHLFEVTYNPATHAATWSADLAGGLGDQPLTDVAVDWQTGDVYVSTDFNVYVRPAHKTTWQPAGSGLPTVATYGLTIDSNARVLYAATHGRGAWKLSLG